MIDLIFVLVEPAVPENIGAAARAIKTMGFHQLALVAPPDYPQEKMFHVAHASKDILENALIFASLGDALSDVDFAIATSAKRRSVRGDYHHAASLVTIIEAKRSSIKKAAIVFGREESGLTNEEIKRCDIVSFLPMKQKYPSLNLSHAVMLYAYLLSGFSTIKPRQYKDPTPGKFRKMADLAAGVMKEVGFKRDSAIYHRVFERLALLKDEDINLVLSFLDKVTKRID